MKNYENIINNIIPADDLHWDEIEKKYVSLSHDEIQEIILRCINQGENDISFIYKMINWCGKIRVGQILWKNFLSGALEVKGFDEEEEPIFGIPTKGVTNEY